MLLHLRKATVPCYLNEIGQKKLGSERELKVKSSRKVSQREFNNRRRDSVAGVKVKIKYCKQSGPLIQR